MFDDGCVSEVERVNHVYFKSVLSSGWSEGHLPWQGACTKTYKQLHLYVNGYIQEFAGELFLEHLMSMSSLSEVQLTTTLC